MPIVNNLGVGENVLVQSSQLAIVDKQLHTGASNNKKLSDNFDATFKQDPFIDPSNVAAYFNGSPWKLTAYYKQILTEESELSGFQSSLSDAYQSYLKINDFEIVVTDSLPLTADQDDQNKTMDLKGSAIVYSSIIPNEGDMFVAAIGNNKNGVFRLTSTKKTSIHSQSCYLIDYSLLNDSFDFINGIDNRVVEEIYFVKSLYFNNKRAFVTKKEQVSILGIKEILSTLVSEYVDEFISIDLGTLLIPNDNNLKIYDHFLVNFIRKRLGYLENKFKYVKLLNVSSSSKFNSMTILDIIGNRSELFTKSIVKEMGVVYPTDLYSDPSLNGINYLDLDYLLFPLNTKKTVSDIDSLTLIPNVLSEQKQNIVYTNKLQINKDINIFNTELPKVSFKPYIFRHSLYTNGLDTLQFESIVSDFINKRNINNEDILMLLESSLEWNPIQRFYYLPILFYIVNTLME